MGELSRELSQWNKRLALVVVRLLLLEQDETHRTGWGILGIAQLPCSALLLSARGHELHHRRNLGPRVLNCKKIVNSPPPPLG